MNLDILKTMGKSCLDVSPHMKEWLKIAAGHGAAITEEDFWGKCLNYQETPHLGNLFQSLVLGQIVSWCRDRGMEASGYVNALDTHLIVEGERISNVEDFERIIDIAIN